jgi:ketosteroid isomerase-like protein
MRVLAFTLLLAACTPAASPAHPMPDVSRVLDDWHDAASKADEERYFSHFAASGVFMGTDATERWTVPQFRAYAHPHFAKGKAWNFAPTRRAVEMRGDVAWFDEDLATPNLGPARGSGVLVWEADRWKIAHYNLTITVPNERMKEIKTLLEQPAPTP